MVLHSQLWHWATLWANVSVRNPSLSALWWSLFKSVACILLTLPIYLVVFGLLLPRNPCCEQTRQSVSLWNDWQSFLSAQDGCWILSLAWCVCRRTTCIRAEEPQPAGFCLPLARHGEVLARRSSKGLLGIYYSWGGFWRLSLSSAVWLGVA